MNVKLASGLTIKQDDEGRMIMLLGDTLIMRGWKGNGQIHIREHNGPEVLLMGTLDPEQSTEDNDIWQDIEWDGITQVFAEINVLGYPMLRVAVFCEHDSKGYNATISYIKAEDRQGIPVVKLRNMELLQAVNGAIEAQDFGFPGQFENMLEVFRSKPGLADITPEEIMKDWSRIRS